MKREFRPAPFSFEDLLDAVEISQQLGDEQPVSIVINRGQVPLLIKWLNECAQEIDVKFSEQA